MAISTLGKRKYYPVNITSCYESNSLLKVLSKYMREIDHLSEYTYFTELSIGQASAKNLSHGDIFLLASATENKLTLPLDNAEGNGMLMMMRGMSVKNFDPTRYAGRWFEVASLKRGFAGQGQEDCHCTQVTRKRLKEQKRPGDEYFTHFRA